jgi:hypothetical protein
MILFGAYQMNEDSKPRKFTGRKFIKGMGTAKDDIK